MFTAYHAKYYAHELTRRHAADGVDRLSQSLFDASVDLNPHQIEAALFALRNPLQEGVLLADEVGLGKTIEAALVVCQYWAERRRRLLVICPASLRKQWAQELHDKFAVPTTVVDAVSLRKQSAGDMLATLQRLVGKAVVIMSYQFAAKLEAELRAVPWDVVVIDEAHKLRNAHRASNRTGQALKRALQGRKKVLLTATPLQNSLMELYGLSTLIDEHMFGDETAFRKQFMNSAAGLDELRERLAGFTKRTLRRDVLEYIKYTERKALTQPFNPTDDEQALYERISAFLQKEDSYALPKQQRHLTALILRKLLASSSHAVAATLVTIRERLQGLLTAGKTQDDGSQLVEQLIAEDDLEQDYLEEEASEAEEDAELLTSEPAEGSKPNASKDSQTVRAAITAEIEELTAFIDAAQALQTDTKAQALLKALNLGFGKMAELRAPRKAIIFTESKRTQEYLHRFLSANGHAGKLVLFSGTNTHEESTAIYQRWLEEYKGTDRVTGSPQVDRRTALIDHFRKDDGTGAEIMIATEAAAEGVNLQFCALIINYDLPWNPQRIEQRIGRCHRYGQKHDVVVVNFVDRSNEADARVYELLSQKFQLFEGVFGASDEVLGAIGSGVDFERRIAEIYQNCREPEEIKSSFEQLQLDLSGEINEAMVKTRQVLLENFDEEVQEKLRMRADDSRNARNRFERMLMDLTRAELVHCAAFDDDGFDLRHIPTGVEHGGLAGIELGRYELPRRSGDAHLYRINHPLARWGIEQAKARALDGARLVFDYHAHGAKISTLEAWRGKAGWLTVKLISVETLGNQEQHLLVAAGTTDGVVLAEEDPEKLLRLPATTQAASLFNAPDATLLADVEARKTALLRDVNERNLGYFEQEVQKLDAWADDLKLGLEQEIKEIDREIKEVRRTAATSPTLEEKLSWQKKQRELESKRSKLRRELFARQDEVEAQRNDLISQLEVQLQQQVEERTLFTVEWELV